MFKSKKNAPICCTTTTYKTQKKIKFILFTIFILSSQFNQAQSIQSIKDAMKLVTDWQLDHFDSYISKVPKWPNDNKRWAWTNGTLYVGLVEWAKISNDPKIWEFLLSIGENESWNLGPRRYHADDICVGQMYVEMYKKYKIKSMIKPTINRLDTIISNPKTIRLDHSLIGSGDRWSWCDALFMAPTTFVRVGKLTGNKKYFRFMDKEFWTTYDTLYNNKDSLFFRDIRYKNLKEKNGENVYWARGNGWVIGGLTIIIDNLPKNYKSRKKYIELYKEMITRITYLQDEKGFWHPSLLDNNSYPTPESSSSAFFTYGIAWGINHGFLEKNIFLPKAQKGWNALLTAIHPDGKLGWVQEIGADPQKVTFEDTEVYGVGAFLLAGSEMLKLQH